MRDPKFSADSLVVVFADLQEGIVNIGATNDAQRLRIRVAALADLAVAFSLPVIVTCVPTTSGAVAPLLTEISSRLPKTTGLVRTTANAMDDLPFRDTLKASGRTTMIIAGIATEVVVRLTGLAAHDDGYHTVVAVDACSGLDERSESATLMHLSAQGVELSTVATIAAQLAGDFNTDLGRAAMRALQSTLTIHTHGNDHEHDPD